MNAHEAINAALNYSVSYEPAGLVYHRVIPAYSFSFLEEHEWSLLLNTYGLPNAVNPPIIRDICLKCGTSRA